MDRLLSVSPTKATAHAPEPLSRRQKVYLYLAGVFLTALLIGDTIGSKLFTFELSLGFTTIHPTLSAGAMWFPITFLLTDVVNEFYGPKGARTITFLGFWMALLAFCVIAIARTIPAAPFSPVSQRDFDVVLGGANRIFIASIIAYLIGQMLDIFIFHSLRRITQARHIWLRSTGSTLVSQLVDTGVVTMVAFYGVIPNDKLQSAAATNYFIKVVAAIALTPVIYLLHTVLHKYLHEAPTSGAPGPSIAPLP